MKSIFSGLYYPYSRTFDTRTLKKAALLFDEIVFLDSEAWFVRRQLLREKPDYNQDAELAYKALTDQGVAKAIDPEPFILEYDNLLTANIVDDVADNAYCKEAIESSVKVWDVLRERIPPTFFSKFYPGCGTFLEAISLQSLMHTNNNPENIADDRVREFAKCRWSGGGKTPEAVRETFLNHYRFAVGGNPHIALESYKLPFLQASSLRINEALLISALDGHMPFTDSGVHDRLLRLKTSRSLRNVDNDSALSEKLALQSEITVPYQTLAVSIIDHLIPDDALDRRTVEEIIAYRRKNKEMFLDFYGCVQILANELGSISPGPEYAVQLGKVISSKVTPEIRKAQTMLTTAYEESFGRLGLRTIATIAPTVTAGVFGGLDPLQIIGVCAAAITTMLGTKGVDDIVKIWTTKREAARTPFAYLTNLHRKTPA